MRLEGKKMKKNLVVLFIALFLFSCFGNKKNDDNTASLQMEEEQTAVKIPVTIEEIKEFITENDEYIKRRNLEITFISKANFGIPGGDNWIVRLNDNRSIIIYVINENKIEKDYYFSSQGRVEHNIFDIMKDIPGTRIGNLTASFGDFNGDGIDELFQYGFGGNANFVEIIGYVVEYDDFINYADNLTFGIIDMDNGPAPVEFMTYNSVYGFKYFVSIPEVAGGPGHIDYEPNPKNERWFFYTWDAEQRQYVEVGEVVD